MAYDLATTILQRHTELLNDRAPYDDRTRKLVRYVLPQEAAGWGVNPDGPKSSPTVDDTARECLDNLVAGLDEMMFRRDPYEVVPRAYGMEESDGYEVAWGDYASQNLNSALEHPNCGFVTSRQLLLRSCAGLGHGVVFITERPGKHLVFCFEPASEVVFAENSWGQVDTLFRQYEMTIRQVMEKQGWTPSPQLLARADQAPGEKVKILRAVFPRREVPLAVHRERMPWACVYIEINTRHVLDEGGFMAFPFVVPRWDRRDSGAYGWAPGMTVLDEIMRVNAMGRSNLLAGHRIADPEVYIPGGMFRPLINRRPGGIHYYDASNVGPNAEVRQWPGAAQLPVTLEMQQAVQSAIRDAYFYYLLQPVQSPNMTATEWIGRQRQLARRVGAPVGRIEQEAADQMGKMAFELLINARAIEPPQHPHSIADFEVRFRSPLSQLKMLANAEAIQRTLEGAAVCAQFDPQRIPRVVDAEETLREQREAFGAPTKMLRSRTKVEELVAADAQRQMAQQAGQAALTGATVAKLAGEARQASNA